MRLPNWKFRNTEAERDEEARRTHESSWPDMFANLQSAYAELTNAQFELERRAAEIAETRDLVQQIVTSMSEALFLTDRAGRVIRANPAAAALLECSEASILGRPLSAVCGAEEIPATPWKLMEIAQDGRVNNLEVEIRTLSGITIPVSFSLSLMHDKQDKITGVLAVARDMREQRNLIASLVAARTRLQELLEYAPDAIVLANQDGQIVLVNSQTEKIFGYSREELLGQSVEVLVPERYRNRLDNAAASEPVQNPDDFVRELDPEHNVQTALALRNNDERAQQVEYFVVNRDGEEFPAEITQRPIVTEDGLLLMSVIRDVSERKRIQEALHLSEERYRGLAETASDVIITMDELRTILFVNSTVEPVFGYRPEELVGKSVGVLLPPSVGVDHAASQVEPGERKSDWSRMEVTALHRNGREVFVEISNSQFIQDGRLLFTSFIRDVTERKLAEERLYQATAVQKAIVDYADYAIITTTPEGTITTFNPAAERMLGYSAAEMIGKQTAALFHDPAEVVERAQVLAAELNEEIEPGFDVLVAKARRGLHNEEEWTYLRKDESRVPVAVSVTAFRDVAGAISGFLTVANDITARKRAELIQVRLSRQAALRADVSQSVSQPDLTLPQVLQHCAEAVVTHLDAACACIWLVNDAGDTLVLQANAGMNKHTNGLPQYVPVGKDKIGLIAAEKQPHLTNDVLNDPQVGEQEWAAREGLAAFAGYPLLFEGRLLGVLAMFARHQLEQDTLNALASVADTIVLGVERRRAEDERARQAALRVEVSNALNEADASIKQMLQRCAEAVVNHAAAAHARIWLLEEAGQTLNLQASAGNYTQLDEAQRQIPLGQTEIGLLAQEKQPHFTNDLTHDPQLSNQEWAAREGLTAFAGYPLLAENRLLGVLALFAKHALNQGTLDALYAAADTIVLGLERKRAEDARTRLIAREAARSAQYAGLRVDVSNSLNLQDLTMQQMLQRCTQAIVTHLDAAFARIWLLNDSSDTLVLQASAGMYTHLNGPHQYVPVGKHKIGLIAQEQMPHVTNDVQNDPRLGDREWAVREGMVAFAGLPLLAEDRLLGVVGMFARHRLEMDSLEALASVADTIVLGVERKRAEEARAALLTREQELRHEAEESSRMKDEFLAMVSHELRAPLTAILGWAQMLRSGTLDRTAAERALLTIERNAKTQAHLVGDLLDASRIVTGKLRLEKKPIELMALIESAIDAVRPSVEAKHLRLQMVLEPWVGPFEGDPERMKQVVWNLLSNAVKFTPPGGLVEVRLERLEDKALLIVSDTGQGIEPEFLPYVFDRFRQADTSSKRTQGGLGLGLAIVKYLVEMHGGAIYAYSGGKDEGSDFMITLPLAVTKKDVREELWAPSSEIIELKAAGSLRSVRVLVVDDERDTREILAVMLSRFGAEVRTAGSVAEGFGLFKQWRPDLLVSDIGMPEEDGYVMISKVRALEPQEGGQTPAIALTAFASSQDRQRTMEAGFQVHLGKPVEPVELARVVARTLGRSEAGIEL